MYVVNFGKTISRHLCPGTHHVTRCSFSKESLSQYMRSRFRAFHLPFSSAIGLSPSSLLYNHVGNHKGKGVLDLSGPSCFRLAAWGGCQQPFSGRCRAVSRNFARSGKASSWSVPFCGDSLIKWLQRGAPKSAWMEPVVINLIHPNELLLPQA